MTAEQKLIRIAEQHSIRTVVTGERTRTVWYGIPYTVTRRHTQRVGIDWEPVRNIRDARITLGY